MKIRCLLFFLTIFCSCKNTNSTETPKNTSSEVDSLPQTVTSPEEKTYYATVDKLRLRKTPDRKGDVLEQIPENEALTYLNESSDRKEKIKLRDQWYEEPWLKVRSKKGNVGWVFGGAVTEEVPKEDITKTPYDPCESAFVLKRNHENYYKCIELVSSQQLEKDSRYIKATETGYQVTLLDGSTRNLVNDSNPEGGDDYREYSYRYYLDRLGYFVFRIHRYEGGDFILMNDKFGYATPIYGMPKLSPDQKTIVITNADAVAGFEFNGIQLLQLSDTGINTLFEEEFDGFAPHNPVWMDEKTIEFDFLSPASDQKPWKVKAYLKENENGNWNLTINNRRE